MCFGPNTIDAGANTIDAGANTFDAGAKTRLGSSIKKI